jgi:hypothetical protein
MSFIRIGDNLADIITGERVFPGDVVFDTGVRNVTPPFALNGRTKVLKESTIVWLAEAAGYTVTRSDAGNSSNTENVDEPDAIVGGGETPTRTSKAGGRKPVK